jgi:hypothetical protein
MRETSWVAEDLLGSQQGLLSVELVLISSFVRGIETVTYFHSTSSYMIVKQQTAYTGRWMDLRNSASRQKYIDIWFWNNS